MVTRRRNCPAGQPIDGAVGVLHGAALVMRMLAHGRQQAAYEFADRFVRRPTQRALLAAVFGACTKHAEEQLARTIVNRLLQPA